MSTWIWLALLSGFFWATSDILSRILADKAHALLGVMLIAVGTFLTGVTLYTINRFMAHAPFLPTENQKILPLFLVAGVLNALGFYFFLKLFQSQGTFTQGLPILFLFILIFTVVYGIIFFKDPVTPKIAVGLLLAAAAVYLLH